MSGMRFILTIDVEEFFQSENLRNAFPVSDWDDIPSRLAEPVDWILESLENQGIASATFFVLGFVARKHPDLVRRIADRGYEVASHGMMHTLNTQLSPDEIAESMTASKKMLEDITGKSVTGYRAPSFTVDESCVEKLRESGFLYDSSFNDVAWHDRYGRLDLTNYEEVSPGVFRHPAGEFFELPISNLVIAGRTIPWGGGGYFRLLPGMIHRPGLMRTLRKDRHFNFYTHPWEYDPDQPRAAGLGAFSSFRHYVGLSRTRKRLIDLIRLLKRNNVPIAGIGDVLAELAD